MRKNLTWVSGFLKNGPSYCDSFAAGWNLHRCGTSLEMVCVTQKANHAFLRHRGNQDGIENGLVDGWNERDKFVNKK